MSYRLIYYNVKGAGEITRMMIHLSKAPFDDVRFKTREEMEAFNAKGDDLVANLGRVPVLEYIDQGVKVSIGQSKTIERFVARKFGLFGSTDIESAYIDMCMEHVRDIKLKYTDIRKGLSGEELEAAKLAFVTGELGTWLTKIEKTLPGGPYAVGDKLSLADLTLFNLVFDYFDHKEEVLKVLRTVPKIEMVVHQVKETLKDYLSTRPECP